MKRIFVACLVVACQSHPDDGVRHRRDPVAARTEPDAAPAPRHSSLPEAGTHPDYPTPRRAGTDKLFVVEEPTRGPFVNVVVVPSKLAMVRHASCEIDDATIVCSKLPPAGLKDPAWLVGSVDGRPVLVQWSQRGRANQQFVLTYDHDGKLTQMAKLDAHGTIAWVRSYWPAGRRYTARTRAGGNALAGCGAMDLTLDDQGRAATTTCLQWSGQPMKDTNGVVTTKYERNDEGFTVDERRLDVGNQPVVGLRDGVHEVVTTYDRFDNELTEKFLDFAGQPVPSGDEDGCYGIATETTNNVTTGETCLDGSGQPMARGDGVTTYAYDHDASWCDTDTRNLDAGGQPVADEDGVVTIHRVADKNCEDTTFACRDGAGAPIACGPGKPATYLSDYDAVGDLVDERFLAPDGSAGADVDYGVPELRDTYDALGRNLTLACLDADGNPMMCEGMGFHRSLSTFDDVGRETTKVYFDESGTPTSNLDVWQSKFIYDNYDHLAEERALDQDGKLTTSHGMSVRRYYYDDGHRFFGMVLLDASGAPAHYDSCFAGLECPSEWQAIRVMRSATGHLLSNEFFDADGQLVSTVDCRQQPCWGDD